MPRHAAHVQHAAGHEGEGLHIGAEQEHAQQRQGRAQHGVNQILDTRGHRVLLAGMHDQRHGEQRHELVEHVEGDDGAGKAQRHQHAQGAKVEGVVPPLMLLMGHVFEGIRPCRRPDKGHDHDEELAHRVGAQEDGQRIRQGEQTEGQAAGEQHGQQRQHVEHQHAQGEQVALALFLKGPDKEHRQPRKNGQKHRNKQIPGADHHDSSSSSISRTS